MATSKETAVDLQSCSPDKLASWLLVHRFKNNAVDTASFLLQCTSTLPNAEEISAQLLGGGGADDEKINETEEKKDDAEKQTSTVPTNSVFQSPPLQPFTDPNQQPLQIELSCTQPRGKFSLQLYHQGIILTNPKKTEEKLTIPASCVENVIWFRKEEEYKKLKQQQVSGKGSKSLMVGGHMVLICFKAGEEEAKVMFRNKELGQACLQLPPYLNENGDAGETKQFTEEVWWTGFNTALCSDRGNVVRVHATMDRPSFALSDEANFTFQSEGASGSSTTTEGMPYVGCYHGLNDGALYPLRDGLLFFKPPMFVHRSKLASISCGRGSGSASRYVDLAVELDSNDRIEFTNIYREELGGLNDYIHKVLIPAMQIDAVGGDDAVEAEVVGSDGGNQSGSDEEEKAGSDKRRKSSRTAAKTAREATRAHFANVDAQNKTAVDSDESDDEEDFEGVCDGSDSDSDSSGGIPVHDEDEAILTSDGNEEDPMDTEEMDSDEDEDNDRVESASRKSKKARTSK